MTREKLLAQTNVRIAESTMDEVDRRVREREREARIPMKRSQVIREILDEWAAAQRDARSVARSA